MKKCPFCAEQIQDEAIKCRFCGEMVELSVPKIKWYFRTQWIVIGFFGVGPLILPLVWFNPHLSRNKKIVFTVVILIVTYYMGVALITASRSIKEYYDLMLQGNIF